MQIITNNYEKTEWGRRAYYYSRGKMLRPKAYCMQSLAEHPADLLVNNSGMSGGEGVFHLHSDRFEDMWISKNNPGKVEIIFDFESIKRLGYLFIWNFNQTYIGTSQDITLNAGIREMDVEYSLDGDSWLIFDRHVVLAKGTGESQMAATNCLDGAPINFDGICARYIKFVPDCENSVGNWGRCSEGEHRYGMSAVRFFEYKPEINVGSDIPFRVCCADDYEKSVSLLNSNLGFKDGRQDNNINNMFLSVIEPKNCSIRFDLDGCYNVKRMLLWNYNGFGKSAFGLRKIKIEYSIDGIKYEFLTETEIPKAKERDQEPVSAEIDFKNRYMRFIRLSLLGGKGVGTWENGAVCCFRYGLSKVRFEAGVGIAVEPARDWDCLLSNFVGWSGADGLFSLPYDMKETKNGSENKKSLLIFSDTFIGDSNPKTMIRNHCVMSNNTLAYLNGTQPGRMDLRFSYNSDDNGIPKSCIQAPKTSLNYYYWLQDAFILNGYVYIFTDDICLDENKPIGFQFKVVGIDLVRIPICNDVLDLEKTEYYQTPFYREECNQYLGCGNLPYFAESGLKGADGFIYIYGLKTDPVTYKVGLIVGRVKPEDVLNFDCYTFYNGSCWVLDFASSSIIIDDGGSEMSVSLIDEGKYKGKFVYIHTINRIGNNIGARISDTPYGPFSEEFELYTFDQIQEFGEKLHPGIDANLYFYNAKAHNHLSRDGELLISANLNCNKMDMHYACQDIYRPRFIRIKNLKE